MRKVLITCTALFVISLIFSACDKDKDENSSTIVGKWFIKAEYDKAYLNGTLSYSDTTDDYTTSDYIEFKSDGSFASMNADPDDNSNGTYTYDGSSKMLVLSDGTYSDTTTVTTLTADKLILYSEESESFEGSNYKYSYEIHFEK